MDFDYLHKLNPEELAFLNKFMEEEMNASFNTNNKKNLNKSAANKRRCYTNNNKRNSDVLTRQNATKRIKYLDEIKQHPVELENKMNAVVELKRMGIIDENGVRLRKKKSRT